MIAGARRLLVALAAVALGWLAASNGIAAGFTQAGDPATATGIAPDADRLSRQAQQLFFDKRYSDAAAAARHALALSPLQTRAVRVLGQAELALGREDAGTAAMLVAAGGGWRDNVTQLWTLQAALDGGDYPAALQRADALIRRGALTDQAFALLRAYAAEPDFRAALVDRLADNPDWRGQMFLDWRRAVPGELPGILRLAGAIDRSRQPVADLELFPLVERMLELGAIAPARAIWQAKAPRAGWAPGNFVYDGRFAVARSRPYGATPPRFEWWVDPDGTSLASVEPAPNGQGPALRMSNNGSGPAVLARQTLVLAPGTYQLLARAYARSERDLAGFAFALRCYPGDKDVLLLHPRVIQMRLDQLRYSSDIVIPANCPRQDLIVRASDGTPFGATIALGEIVMRRVQ